MLAVPSSSIAPSTYKSLWLSKRFRGAAYNSFRSAAKDTKADGGKDAAKSAPNADEIDKMKARAEKNNMFVYVNITSVPFIVSYKVSTSKFFSSQE